MLLRKCRQQVQQRGQPCTKRRGEK